MGHLTVAAPGIASNGAATGCGHNRYDELPEVRILGRVNVTAGGPVDHSHRHRLTELGVFLALSEPDLTHHLVDEAIWPGHDVAMATRHTALSRLRRWWGTDAAGCPYVQRHAYRVRCRTDWAELCRLTRYPGSGVVELAQVGTEDLVAGLQLVGGRPFAGVSARRFRWAEMLRANAEYLIDAIAGELIAREHGQIARFAEAVRSAAVPWSDPSDRSNLPRAEAAWTFPGELSPARHP